MDLVEEVVEQFRSAIEAEGSSWVAAAIPFEVAEMRISAGVAYYVDSEGNKSGVLLEDGRRSDEIARELTRVLSESTETEVRRVRVNVASDWSTSVDHFGPRPNPDDIGQDFGIMVERALMSGANYVETEGAGGLGLADVEGEHRGGGSGALG